MSGGYFDYKQHEITDLADAIARLINGNTRFDGRKYSPETLARFKEADLALHRAFVYVHRIDYLASGDDDEDTFHALLKKGLENFKPDSDRYRQALLEITKLSGMCIYGSPAHLNLEKDDPLVQEYRKGSADAFRQCSVIAWAALNDVAGSNGANHNSLEEIEAAIAKNNCVCGGTISFSNNVMLCSDCGYSAKVEFRREDAPVALGEPDPDGPGEEDGPWAEGWEERSGEKP